MEDKGSIPPHINPKGGPVGFHQVIQGVIMALIISFLFTACGGKREAVTIRGEEQFIKTGKEISGKASWYGKQFKGRKTANGERFDPKHFTAAHKSLPFNTYLMVKNPANEKSIVVRINDRGPYAKGRVLDLSQAAAQYLDFIKQGTAKVIAEILMIKGDGKEKVVVGPVK